MNAVFVVGLFVLPRFIDDERRAGLVKLAAIGLGSSLFVYAKYGEPLATTTPIPAPAVLLGQVATFRLPETVVTALMRMLNSVLVGPFAVAGLALVMNHLFAHRALRTTPLLRHGLPRRDPEIGVIVSTMVGTTFYLMVVAVTTGKLIVLP